MSYRFSIIFFSFLFFSCDKFDWNNPYDPECPKEFFTPSSPGAAMEGNSVKLTWSQQNDDISGFALFRSAEGESISNLTQTQKSVTQYIDASITPGKKYTYYVVAVAGTNKSDTVKTEIVPIVLASVSTGSLADLTSTSARIVSNVLNAGGATVSARGICWSTNPGPTISNNKLTAGSGVGQFELTLSNLLIGTTYYARAYAENSRGISYGNEIIFKTIGPPPSQTINEGLFAYYPFNGNANDVSGNGKNGVVSGAIISSDRFGSANQSYFFNGINSYISISESILPSTPTTYSISLWCKLVDLQSLTTYNDIMCDRSQLNYDYKYRIGIHKNNLNEAFYISAMNGNNTESTIANKQTLNLNWVHLVSIVDITNNKILLYLNGAQVASLNRTSYPSHLNSTFIGVTKFPSGFEGFFNGNIDDIRIYNRTLTQEEITYLANN